MKRLSLQLFAVSIFLLASLSMSAEVKVQRQHLTTTDGLANNSVRYILQDSKGFLWLCTLNGLSRYDGHHFINFMPKLDGSIGLAGYRPSLLYEDKNGFLWITFFGDKISCYDLRHDCFVDFTGCGKYKDKYANVTIANRNDVWLWGRSKGALRVTWDGKNFTSELFDAESALKTDNINFVSSSKDGKQVWIGTDKGLYLWKEGKIEVLDAKQNFSRIRIFDSGVTVVTSEGKVLVCIGKSGLKSLGQMAGVSSKNDITGELSIGTRWLVFTRKGAYLVDMLRGALTTPPHQWDIAAGSVVMDNHGDYWIHNRTGKLRYLRKDGKTMKELTLMSPAQSALLPNERFFIIRDSRGQVWISTYGNGVYTYNPTTEKLTHYLAGGDKAIISGNTIQFMMEDRSGSIWICSEYCGVNHLKVINDGATRLFPSNEMANMNCNDVRLITAEKDGDIIVSTRDGKVSVYDPTLSTQKQQMHFDKNLYAVIYDRKGRKWSGTRGDGLFIDGIQYKHNGDDPQSLAANDIFCFLDDRQGRMWIGTFGGGLDLAMENADGTFSFRHFFNKEYSEKRVNCMAEDTEGRIWMGTSDGIFVFYPDSLIANPQSFRHYNMAGGNLYSDEIRAIICDRAGNIWIAETGAGFAMFDAENPQNPFLHFGVKDGLVNAMVQAFLDARPNQLWITTEYGISCFNTKKQTFENYFFADDMAGNTYSQGSAFLLSDGRLAFGSKQGLAIVDPSKTRQLQAAKKITFTALYANGVPSVSNPDIETNDAIAYTDKITLPYNQNSIRIDFSVFDYSSLMPRNYVHLLEGYDSDWSEPTADPFVVYKNLPYGTYTLHVKEIGGEESTIVIRITPPWWLSPWAYLLYIVCALALALFVFRHVRRIESLNNRIRLEEQLTDFKLKFFTNVSHEFRTPLTLINGALERMRRNENLPADTKVSLQVMEKSSQRMMRLINQILEFRTVQKGKAQLSLIEVDIVAFLREIYESFIDSAVAKRIDMRLRTSHESFVTFIDKDKMDKVVYNLLSNALKYTLSEGSITMTVDVMSASQELMIKVIDTGIGIPEENRAWIFERFSHGKMGLDSMGIGLNLTYELVKIHHGNISYAENPQGGSVFTVIIPTSRETYQKEDYVAAITDKASSIDKAENLAEPEHVENPENSSPLNNRRILLIEDDNDVREFLRIELSTYFEVETASDGISGYDYAANNAVDLIVCDVLMPGMTGFEVTRKLKDNFETSHIPIILATALTANDKQIEGFKSGADAYITKPFSTEVLINRIFQLIEQRDRLREKFSTDLSMVTPITVTNDKDKEFVDRLNEIIEKNISNDALTAEDFASMMGHSRTIFFRKVKGLTGYTPKEYLKMLRLKKAAELLRHPDITIANVAYKVGFSDPLYFSKCFKAQFNQSPTTYRKEALKEK